MKPTNASVRTPAVVADSLTFRYGRRAETALNEVVFTIAAGERVAIMGRTAAGKTTLAMTINGLVPQFHSGEVSGAVVVAGMDTQRFRVQTLVRHVGLVMQEPETQIFGRTVAEDVAFGPLNLGLPRDEVLRRIPEALVAVGLEGFEERTTDSLSGGEKQRLALAGIYAMRPDILVLDEPTSELDPEGAHQVLAALEVLASERPLTLLLVTHSAEEAARFAERLIVLERGTVVYDGPMSDAVRRPERLIGWGIRPPDVAVVGQRLADRGAIDAAQIPTGVAEAGRLINGLVSRTADRAVDNAAVPPTAETAVETASLGHRYAGDRWALRDVSIAIRRGEFVAIVGRNGAGKTTFARHLNGLLRPTAGGVALFGASIAGRETADLASTVGYVFQNPDHQIFAGSVRDEVAYGLRNAGVAADEIDERVTRVLERLSLGDMADRHPFTLGRGQRQRLAVASVLVLEPRILVVDEPTTGQDSEGALEMMAMMEALRAAGTTILMITHDMALVAGHADRVLVFSAGRLIDDAAPHEVFGHADVLDEARLRVPQAVELAAVLFARVGQRAALTPEGLADAIIGGWERGYVA